MSLGLFLIHSKIGALFKRGTIENNPEDEGGGDGEEPEDTWIERTTNEHWVDNAVHVFKLLWNSENGHWYRNTATFAYLQYPNSLNPVGGWTEGFRPKKLRVTMNSGPSSGQVPVKYEVSLLLGNNNYDAAGLTFLFTGYNQEMTLTTDCDFTDENNLDIAYLNVISYLKNVGPYITKIEFAI